LRANCAQAPDYTLRYWAGARGSRSGDVLMLRAGRDACCTVGVRTPPTIEALVIACTSLMLASFWACYFSNAGYPLASSLIICIIILHLGRPARLNHIIFCRTGVLLLFAVIVNGKYIIESFISLLRRGEPEVATALIAVPLVIAALLFLWALVAFTVVTTRRLLLREPIDRAREPGDNTLLVTSVICLIVPLLLLIVECA